MLAPLGRRTDLAMFAEAAMKLGILALDYDGTIAENGVLHPEVRAAIHRARGGHRRHSRHRADPRRPPPRRR
jgi:hypothetical protein